MKKGFTLIELLAVIVVLTIITVIAIPTMIGVVNKVRLQSLKSSAYGLIEAGTLYHAQYDNQNNARFDITNNEISTNEENKIKYKGYIKQGTVIVSKKGGVTVCISDGKNSAYKNYNETEVTLISNKSCAVPSNTSVVYLNGEATIDSLDAKAILDKISELDDKLNGFTTSMSILKYGVITQTTTVDLGEEINPSKYMVNIHTSGYNRYAESGHAGANSYGYGDGAYVSAKTSTSVTITLSAGITASYEIVKLG